MDAKVTSWSMIRDGVPRTLAICGPTHEQQDVFAWAPKFVNVTRDGVPDKFPFSWVDMPVSPPTSA